MQPESPVVSQWSRGSNQPDLRRIACNPNYWYPLAWGRQLKRNKTLSVAFAGDPIVLVRTDSNRVFALEDRCAHRQFPLSKGTVCGEQIQCGYHAWRYDASGDTVQFSTTPVVLLSEPSGLPPMTLSNIEPL